MSNKCHKALREKLKSIKVQILLKTILIAIPLVIIIDDIATANQFQSFFTFIC